MMIPNMIGRPKPRITSPPICARGRIERTTVSDVATVRPRVWFDAEVDELAQRHRPKLGEILPDTVVDHDLVGDRVADQGQQCRHRIEVELDLGDGEEPDRLGDV